MLMQVVVTTQSDKIKEQIPMCKCAAVGYTEHIF